MTRNPSEKPSKVLLFLHYARTRFLHSVYYDWIRTTPRLPIPPASNCYSFHPTLFIIVTFSMTYSTAEFTSLFIPFGLPSHLLFIYIYYCLITYSQSLIPHPTESELYLYSLLFIVLLILSLVVKLQKVMGPDSA